MTIRKVCVCVADGTYYFLTHEVILPFITGGFPPMVRCFYCDVETEIKSDGIDTWVHHAQVSPDCAFLINTRGMRFVNDVCLILRHDPVTVSCGLFGQ